MNVITMVGPAGGDTGSDGDDDGNNMVATRMMIAVVVLWWGCSPCLEWGDPALGPRPN